MCALALTDYHMWGCVLTYKERGFRGGGGLNLVLPGDPPPPYQITSVLDMICIHLLAITNEITCR